MELHKSKKQLQPGRGETQGAGLVEILPEVCKAICFLLMKEDLLCRHFYTRHTCNWYVQVQKRDWEQAEAVVARGADQRHHFIHRIAVNYTEEEKENMSIFTCCLFEVEKTITSRAPRRPSYFNYIVPKLPSPISLPFPQPLPFTNTHKKASHYTLTSPLPAPCNYTICRKHLFLGSVNVWVLLESARLSEKGRGISL